MKIPGFSQEFSRNLELKKAEDLQDILASFTEALESVFESQYGQFSYSKAEGHLKEREIAQTLEFVCEWVKKNLGLEVADRLISLKNVLIFAKKEYPKLMQNMDSAGSDAHYSPLFCKIAVEENKSNFFRHALAHETVHSLSATILVFSRHSNDTHRHAIEPQSGLHTKGKFEGLNEAITELMAWEILGDMSGLKKNKLLESLSPSYFKIVVTFGLLINELAKKTNTTPDEMRREFYTAMINRDIAFLRIVEQEFGAGSLSYISKIKGSDLSEMNDVYAFLDRFGLSREKFQDVYANYKRGGKFFEYLDRPLPNKSANPFGRLGFRRGQ